MSLSSKRNLGHKRRLNHSQKRKLARRLRGLDEQYNGLFQSLNWRKRKWSIMQRVKRQQIRAKYYAEVRRGERGKHEIVN